MFFRLVLGLNSHSTCKPSNALVIQWSKAFPYGQGSLSKWLEEVPFISKWHLLTLHFSLIVVVEFSGPYQKSSSLTLIIFHIHWFHLSLKLAGAGRILLQKLINEWVEGFGSWYLPFVSPFRQLRVDLKAHTLEGWTGTRWVAKTLENHISRSGRGCDICFYPVRFPTKSPRDLRSENPQFGTG